MAEVKQFRYAADNLGYLIYSASQAVVVDGGAFRDILSFIRSRNLDLLWISNTHSHADHMVGNRALLENSNARYLSYFDLLDMRLLELNGSSITVYRTPGHTVDSVCFRTGRFLLTGDTLFNGTVGNCFSGDLKIFFHSVKRIMTLPGDTVIYAGHDYVRDSMKFARRLDPDNPDIDSFMKKYEPGHVLSTLDDEFRINPYLRFNEERIVSLLKKRGLPVDTEWDRWKSLMSIE
ncbi:MAG: MBL fold metallo-hydrolase [Syntrophales bacterium]